jgi:hypothetical protein
MRSSTLPPQVTAPGVAHFDPAVAAARANFVVSHASSNAFGDYLGLIGFEAGF